MCVYECVCICVHVCGYVYMCMCVFAVFVCASVSGIIYISLLMYGVVSIPYHISVYKQAEPALHTARLSKYNMVPGTKLQGTRKDRSNEWNMVYDIPSTVSK